MLLVTAAGDAGRLGDFLSLISFRLICSTDFSPLRAFHKLISNGLWGPLSALLSVLISCGSQRRFVSLALNLAMLLTLTFSLYSALCHRLQCSVRPLLFLNFLLQTSQENPGPLVGVSSFALHLGMWQDIE